MTGLLVLICMSVVTLVGCEDDDGDDDGGVQTVVADDGTVVTRYPDGTVVTNGTYSSAWVLAGNTGYFLSNDYSVVVASWYVSTNFAGYEFEGQAFTNCADFQAYLDETYTNTSLVLVDCVDPTNDETTISSP